MHVHLLATPDDPNFEQYIRETILKARRGTTAGVLEKIGGVVFRDDHKNGFSMGAVINEKGGLSFGVCTLIGAWTSPDWYPRLYAAVASMQTELVLCPVEGEPSIPEPTPGSLRDIDPCDGPCSGYECDWGSCNRKATCERFDPDNGWLLCCSKCSRQPYREDRS